MAIIGAKDNLDRALVRQYASSQTTNFDSPKIDSEEMWDKINMLAQGQMNHINLLNNMKKVL